MWPIQVSDSLSLSSLDCVEVVDFAFIFVLLRDRDPTFSNLERLSRGRLSGWRQSVQLLNRSSRSRRTAPLTRRKNLERRTVPKLWGTHIGRRVIEMGAKCRLNRNWIAHNQPRLRT